MTINFAPISDETLAAIVYDIENTGFGVAANCIDEADLQDLHQIIDRRVAAQHGEYLALTGVENLTGTGLDELGRSPNFVAMCQKIYERGTGQPAPDSRFYQVLRCLAGESGKRHAFFFHFDSYVLTVVMPVIMPVGGQSGDLLIVPNIRGLRRSYLRNLFDKLLLDNQLTQIVLRRLACSGTGWIKKVPMKPGNLYFFWGCRSIHANEPCDADKIRATAIFHYVDPHAASWLRGALGRKGGPVGAV